MNFDVIAMSGSAGAALATVGTYELIHPYNWLEVTVTSSGAALTDFAFLTLSQGETTYITKLSGTDWADASKFHDGEESGVDASANQVNALASGGSLKLKLNVTGLKAVRFQALGSGATVTINGRIVG